MRTYVIRRLLLLPVTGDAVHNIIISNGRDTHD